MRTYCNYHIHSDYSNIFFLDSPVTKQAYAERATKLGHSILSSCEHGYAGNFLRVWQIAKDYGLKFVFAAELYWVKDRFAEVTVEGTNKVQRDRANNHIVLVAKTMDGMRQINRLISEANDSGYYYRPRVDLELLMTLNPKDVLVTTACLAFYNYGFEESERIIRMLHEHFQSSLYLEVQAHHEDRQREVNRFILKMYRKYNIPVIAGVDSHYIFPDDDALRNDLQSAALHGGSDNDESGFFMDYPDGDTLYERFVEQGVLPAAVIEEALRNTLQIAEFEEFTFDRTRKIPNPYRYDHPEYTYEDRVKIYKKLIWDSFEEKKAHIPEEMWPTYEREINYEVDTMVDGGVADYALLDWKIVNRGIEKGGLITRSGRGCFTESAMVTTKAGLKSIKDVSVGDEVVDMNGNFKKVLKTFRYEIDEPTIEIICVRNKMLGEYPRCTLDHKILINRDGHIDWIPAKDIEPGDYACVPKIKTPERELEYFDLCEFDTRHYPHDDEWIYEFSDTLPQDSPLNPKTIGERYGISKAAAYNFISGRKGMSKESWRGKIIFDTKERILKDFGFNSQTELTEAYNAVRTKKIRRFVPKDRLFYLFAAMMYGDGWIREYEAGLAVNPNTSKNTVNRNVFTTFMERCGIKDFREAVAKDRSLIQICVRSLVLFDFLSTVLFFSHKGKKKQFNPELLNCDADGMQAIYDGLMATDGCVADKSRLCFDNTSLSIINAYRIAALACGAGVPSLKTRWAWKDSRGYNCSDSYKCCLPVYSRQQKRKDMVIDGDDYWFIPVLETKVYEQEPMYVYDLSVEDSHSFLLNNMIVHNSGPSFYTNSLLGFSTMDRMALPVKMYPDRFVSKPRLVAGQIPDLDLNVADRQPFLDAQKEVVGEGHAFPMIAYTSAKKKRAWKMYCISRNFMAESEEDKIPQDTVMEISEQLDRYDMAVKHSAEDDEINVEDYVSPKYIDLYKRSEAFWGLVVGKVVHPCAVLVYDGDIRSEIGLVRAKSESGKLDELVTPIDGVTADAFGYVKND